MFGSCKIFGQAIDHADKCYLKVTAILDIASDEIAAWNTRSNTPEREAVAKMADALKLITGCWCARVESPMGRPPVDADDVIQHVIHIAEEALAEWKEAQL
jgi:hypothetical protein